MQDTGHSGFPVFSAPGSLLSALRSLLSALCSMLFTLCLTYSAEGAFKDNFLSARSVAMGGACAALANDADGALVNPAGLTMVRGHQIIATAAALYVGLSDESFISQNILGYAHQRKNIGTIGAVWKRLAADNLYSENVLALSLAKDFRIYRKEEGEERGKNFSVGVVLNFMNWDSAPTIGADGKVIEDLPGWSGFSFDIGSVIWPSGNTPVAVAIQNLNKPNIASGSSMIEEELPMAVRMGVAAIGENVTWAMDMILWGGQLDLRVGLERRYDWNFRLRAGFSLENLAWGTNFTLGAGYKPSDSTRIDYALIYPVNTILDTLGSHRISVVYTFGK